MSSGLSGPWASTCDIGVKAMGFELPGPPIDLASLELDRAARRQLEATGQEFTYRASGTSTDLALAAGRKAIGNAGVDPAGIGMVISAPTLLTSYGLEIPAIAVAAELGLDRTHCLNVSQGCVGALAAMRIASQFLKAEPDRGDVLIVTACKASTLMDNFTHGGFFWGDAGGAVVLTADPTANIRIDSYVEVSADRDWGAMRVPFGDARLYEDWTKHEDFRVSVEFASAERQIDYIKGEQQRCSAVVDCLLSPPDIESADIDAVFFPSFGRRRVPLLLEDFPDLIDRVATDFSCAHMGGVDVLYFLDRFIADGGTDGNGRYLALTPAFTAQWAGVSVSRRGA